MDVAAVRDAGGAGVGCRPPVGGEERDLAELLLLVRCDKLGERSLGRLAGAEQIEPPGPVAALGERLRRDRADARASPRAERDAEGARLHRDAELAVRLVPTDDRVRHMTEPS